MGNCADDTEWVDQPKSVIKILFSWETKFSCTKICPKVTEVCPTRKCTSFGCVKQDGKEKHYLFSHF